MKRAILAASAALAGAGALALGASAAAVPTASLTIKHVVAGCHSWTLGSGPLKVAQAVSLKTGGSLTIVNTDLMPHQFLKLTGPATPAMQLVSAGLPTTGTLKAPYALGMMPHMNSRLKVTFTKPGTYTFTTKAGEDYVPNVKTTGEDHVLTLKVVVG